MSLALPDDYDGEKHSDVEHHENPEEPTEGDNPDNLTEPDTNAVGDADTALSDLQHTIEAHADAIQMKAEQEELAYLYGTLEDIQETVEGHSNALNKKANEEKISLISDAIADLHDRIDDLQNEIQATSNYLQELEKSRRGRIEALDRNTEAITSLSAAVFDEERSCPKCDKGDLMRADPWVGHILVCSNDSCGFEKGVVLD